MTTTGRNAQNAIFATFENPSTPLRTGRRWPFDTASQRDRGCGFSGIRRRDVLRYHQPGPALHVFCGDFCVYKVNGTSASVPLRVRSQQRGTLGRHKVRGRERGQLVRSRPRAERHSEQWSCHSATGSFAGDVHQSHRAHHSSHRNWILRRPSQRVHERPGHVHCEENRTDQVLIPCRRYRRFDQIESFRSTGQINFCSSSYFQRILRLEIRYDRDFENYDVKD
jgi:hypothetical protein